MIVSIHILFGFPPFFYRRAKMRRWPAGVPVGKSRHIREAKDVLFLGPPGVGKTHLAQGIGHEAIHQNFLVLYRFIFDPGARLPQITLGICMFDLGNCCRFNITSAFRQQSEQFGFHIMPRLLRVVSNSHSKQLVHIRAKSAVGQMRVQNCDKLRPSGNAAFQFKIMLK